MSKTYGLAALTRYNLKVSELGCVMLNVEIPYVKKMIPPHCEPYHSSKLSWVSGIQKEGHVTLLYGLIPELVDKEGVDEVLEGWRKPTRLYSTRIEVFEQDYVGEKFACVVSLVATSSLFDAHQRLSMLPHINTFPEYKPHVTLMYTELKDAEAVRLSLEDSLPLSFVTGELNYGDALS